MRATGIPVAETFMGKGLLDPEDPKALGLGGFAVRRLQHGRLRRRRPGAGDRLRPGRALAGALEPEPGQEDHLHRLGPGEIDAYSCPRSSWWATCTTSSPGWARSAGTCRTRAVRNGCGIVSSHFDAAKDNDQFPAAAAALYEIRKALGREDVLISDVGLQALDRAHVPGLRAQHRPDRQRPRRDGVRGARRSGGQAGPPGPQR